MLHNAFENCKLKCFTMLNHREVQLETTLKQMHMMAGGSSMGHGVGLPGLTRKACNFLLFGLSENL